MGSVSVECFGWGQVAFEQISEGGDVGWKSLLGRREQPVYRL